MFTYYNDLNGKTEQITTLPAFTNGEMRQINLLVQNALLSSQLRQRLMNADTAIQTEFNLPHHVWAKLSQINASSLSDFCGELMRLQGN